MTEPSPRSLLEKAVLAVEAAEARLAEFRRRQNGPASVLGLACRLPNGIEDADSLRDFLRQNGDAIAPIPRERSLLFDRESEAGRKENEIPLSAALLKDPLSFDAPFFGISEREATFLDPQHRWLLETAWHALEDAAIDPTSLASRPVGIFVGISSVDWSVHLARHVPSGLLEGSAGTGSAKSAAAGRLAYFLGTTGPAISYDTACSSSLVALHGAIASLRNRECELAIVAGVNLIASPIPQRLFAKAGMLAKDGRCKTFSAAADGYGRGEGGLVLVLCLEEDTSKFRSRVRASILSVAVNQDGASAGLTVPSGEAQAKVIRSALAEADLLPEAVGAIEAHGTGTALGDPIEVAALGEVFRGRPTSLPPIALSSLKTNLGHLEAAAGLAGVAKAVLSVQHAEIFAHLHADPLSKHIPWTDLPFQIPRSSAPWPKSDRRRIAGVSSFSFIGTNAHALVAEAPSVPAPVLPDPELTPEPRALLLSAASKDALHGLARAVLTRLAQPDAREPRGFQRAAETALRCRARLAHRLAVVASSSSEAQIALSAFLDGKGHPGVHEGVAPSTRPRVLVLLTGSDEPEAGVIEAWSGTFPKMDPAVSMTTQVVQACLAKRVEAGFVLAGVGAGEALAVLLSKGRDGTRRLRVFLGSLGGELLRGQAPPKLPPAIGAADASEIVDLVNAAPCDVLWAPNATPSLASAIKDAVAGTRVAAMIGSSDDSFAAAEWQAFAFVRGIDCIPECTNPALLPSWPLTPFVRKRLLPPISASSEDGVGHPYIVKEPPTVSENRWRTRARVRAGDALTTSDPKTGEARLDAAGLLELVLASASAHFPDHHYLLRDFRILEEFPIESQVTVTVDFSVLRPLTLKVEVLIDEPCMHTLARGFLEGKTLAKMATGPADASTRPLPGCEPRNALLGPERLRRSFGRLNPEGGRIARVLDLTLVRPPEDGSVERTFGNTLQWIDAGETVVQAEVEWGERERPRPRLGRETSRALGVQVEWVRVPPLEVRAETLRVLLTSPRAAVNSRSLWIGETVLEVPADQDLSAFCRTLVQQLSSTTSNGRALHIVDATGLDLPDDPPPEEAIRTLKLTLELKWALLLALRETKIRPRITWLSRRSTAVLTERELTCPLGAAFQGLSRSLRLEDPSLDLIVLDLETATVPSPRVLEEHDECEASRRFETWFRPRLVPARSASLDGDLNSSLGFAPDRADRALVTGGTGALGRAFVRVLTMGGPFQVKVLSRRPPEGSLPERVEFVAADVTDALTLRQGLPETEQRERPALCIHLAGQVADATLEKVDFKTFEQVASPKILGLINLFAILPTCPILAASSAAAWLGSPGQSAYAAANSVLEALCTKRRGLGIPTAAIAFGPLQNAGMSARTAGHAERLASSGILAMEPEDAAIASLALIEDLGFKERMLVKLDFARLGTLASKSLLRRLETLLGLGPPLHHSGPAEGVPDDLALAPDRIRGHLERCLRRILRISAPDFPWSITLLRLGCDSLGSIDLRNELLRARLSDVPTPTEILKLSAESLVQRLLETPSRPASEHARP